MSGEVLIKGDLVIKGTYSGIANVYVAGNIYIPGDVLGQRSPFPYSTDVQTAMTEARAALTANMDALGLATPGSIFVSDIEGHPRLSDGLPNNSVFTDHYTPAEDQAAKLGVDNIYGWFPGGEVGYDALYDTFNVGCYYTPDRGQNNRSISPSTPSYTPSSRSPDELI